MTVVFKRITIVLIALLILFGCSEIFFRTKYKEELKDQFSPLIYGPDSLTGYRYIPNSEGEISKPGIGLKKVRINNQGFYSPDFTTQKKPGTYRIAIVGTSTASGIWMDGTQNFSSRLQRMFDADKKKNVEVLNCGLDGQGLGKGLLEIIKTKVVNYDPDLILLELSMPLSIGSMYRTPYKGYLLQYYTDSSKDLAKQAIDNIERDWFFRFCYDYFYTYRAWCRNYIQKNKLTMKSKLLRTYRDKISRIEDIDFSFYKFQKSIDLLKETNDTITRKSNAKLVLYSYDSDQKGVTPYLQANGFNVIFLKCIFEKKHISFPDSHLNEHGHALVADSLFRILTTNNFFNKDL
jgi:hypothetical protein